MRPYCRGRLKNVQIASRRISPVNLLPRTGATLPRRRGWTGTSRSLDGLLVLHRPYPWPRPSGSDVSAADNATWPLGPRWSSHRSCGGSQRLETRSSRDETSRCRSSQQAPESSSARSMGCVGLAAQPLPSIPESGRWQDEGPHRRAMRNGRRPVEPDRQSTSAYRRTHKGRKWRVVAAGTAGVEPAAVAWTGRSGRLWCVH